MPADWQRRLAERRAADLFRCRDQVESGQAARVRQQGREFLNFRGNDYLGLARHPDVIRATQEALSEWGVGSGASHLLGGHSREHHALEEELADFTGRERALLFSTGYMANLGILGALVGKRDQVFEDRLNHASLIDAGLASDGRFRRYLHNDPGSLEKHLQRRDGDHAWLVTDAVFSMDGDIAPLPELADIAERHDATLVVDDAHGIGVLGDSGAGCCEHFGLQPARVPVLMGTLGKAFGVSGAFVAGGSDLIEALIQFARPYIYTTAMPPAFAAAARASLCLVRSEGWRRERLRELIGHFRGACAREGIPLMDSMTPIQPVLTGDSLRTMAVARALSAEGIIAGAVRPPTVPADAARLRITLSAGHELQDIDTLVTALARALQAAGPDFQNNEVPEC